MAEPQGQLWPELDANLSWMHIMRGMIMDGRIAEMGLAGWAVYNIIKAHTDLKTGDAAPTRDRIADLAGVSAETVDRAIKKLEQMNLVQKVGKRGRQNVFGVIEHIPVNSAVKNSMVVLQAEGMAVQRYKGLDFSRFLEDIKSYIDQGNVNQLRPLNINFNVTVVNANDNATVNIVQQGVELDRPQVLNALEFRNLTHTLAKLEK